MKIRAIIISLLAMLCVVSCSRQGGLAGKSKGLVPATAAEIAASPDFKLDHTTKSGLKIYVRELTPEIAKTISVDSPDFRFLQGDREHVCFLLVLIRGGRVVDADKDFHDVKSGDLGEILNVIMQHMRQAQETFKGATNK